MRALMSGKLRDGFPLSAWVFNSLVIAIRWNYGIPRQGLDPPLFSVRCLLNGVRIKPTLLSAFPGWLSTTQQALRPRAGWPLGTVDRWPATWPVAEPMCTQSSEVLRGCGVLTRFAAFLRSEVANPWHHLITVLSLLWGGPRGKERAIPHTQKIVKSVISKQRLNSSFGPGLFRCPLVSSLGADVPSLWEKAHRPWCSCMRKTEKPQPVYPTDFHSEGKFICRRFSWGFPIYCWSRHHGSQCLNPGLTDLYTYAREQTVFSTNGLGTIRYPHPEEWNRTLTLYHTQKLTESRSYTAWWQNPQII